MKRVKVIGITRIRNEEEIIRQTLDHVASFVDEVHVCDDASTDNTVEVCREHPIVTVVKENSQWASDPVGRNRAEGILRQRVWNSALKAGADFIYYFDADEYIEPDVDFKHDAYFFRLFDFYITPEDVNKPFLERKWMGPEYRDIPMLFRASNKVLFTQRVPHHPFGNPFFGGYVRHYGKAISVEQFESTVNYYVNHRWKDKNQELWRRWGNRKGKAIHTESDFGRELITWEEKNSDKIVKL